MGAKIFLGKFSVGVDDGEVDAATALSGIENDGGELGEVGVLKADAAVCWAPALVGGEGVGETRAASVKRDARSAVAGFLVF